MGSSRTRARTCVPCIDRRFLNHCATREVQGQSFCLTAQLCCSRSRSLCLVQHLCTRPTAAILNCSVLCSAFPHGPPSWGVRRSHYALGTLVWSASCKASARGTLWASKTRRTQRKRKKKLDFILLPRFFFYFLGIVNGLCWWQNHSEDKWLLLVMSGKVRAASTYYTWHFVLVVSI